MELSEKHDKLSSWTGWARLYCLNQCISGICEVYFNELGQQISHFLLREVNLSSVNRDASLLMTVYCNCFETAWQNQDPSLLNCIRKLLKKLSLQCFAHNHFIQSTLEKCFRGFYHPRHNNAIPDSAPEAFVVSEQWEMSGRPLCHMWCLWLTFETGLWDTDSGWSKNNPGEMQFSTAL